MPGRNEGDTSNPYTGSVGVFVHVIVLLALPVL